jgi:SAM-dependent methyltransferase
MKLIASGQDYIRGGTQKDYYDESEVVHVPCPLCGRSEGDAVYKEHGAIGIKRCGSCGLIYTSPRIKSPESIYWGDTQTYYDEARLIFEGTKPHHRDPNYLCEIAAIERHKRPGRIMDVGCNMGMLLRLAVKRGWQAVGVEPSPSLAPLAQRHGFKVYNCFLRDVPRDEDQSFDVVALSDVFEHITEPLEMLAQASRFMKPDGVLYVKVPNARWSLLKQKLLGMMGRRPEQGLWDAYEHVVHYTDTTLTQMLARAGLRVVAMSVEPPVQTPNWHELVGHYYQYPTPWFVDWQRKTVRLGFYWLCGAERLLRRGSIGFFAPNLVAIATKA